MTACDILIKNGQVVDGTGSPPRIADVVITGDKLVAVGPNAGAGYQAAETVDATGLTVTPGWCDIHTHYDGQVTWDSLLTPSTQHGVTTVAFGNCGIGFAPCRAEDREKLILTLQSVEDIPEIALIEGVSWNWETFPQYMEELSKTHAAADFMAMVGHVPVRLYAMGADRVHQEANDQDLIKIRQLVQEAMEAGAFGLSTSRTLVHRDPTGTPIPGTYVGRKELTEMMAGMAEGGGGFFEMINDLADELIEFDWIAKLSSAYDIPVSLTITTANPRSRLRQCEWLEKVNAMGANVTAQTSLKTQAVLQNLHSKYHPFIGHPTYDTDLAPLPYDQRLAAMRDPIVRAKILSEKSFFEGAPFANSIFNPAMLFSLVDSAGVPRYERDPATESFAAIAASNGTTDDVMGLIYDALTSEQTLFAPLGTPLQQNNLDLLAHPHIRVGLGDGGAHLGIFQESSCPTFMLSHYTRDRDEAAFGQKILLETAVMWQSHDTARLVGLHDRGVLAPGMRADVNIIDMAQLQLKPPYVVADLPGGNPDAIRWLQDADGYRMTVCAGQVTFRDGLPTGALPGRLVKNPFRAKKMLEMKQSEMVVMATDDERVAGPEPKSTADMMVSADSTMDTGGASAIARAANANFKRRADVTSGFGDFLSGKVIKDKKQNISKMGPSRSKL